MMAKGTIAKPTGSAPQAEKMKQMQTKPDTADTTPAQPKGGAA